MLEQLHAQILNSLNQAENAGFTMVNVLTLQMVVVE
jgi:hypothetical protein